MSIKIGFAGDRQIAVDILSYIIEDEVPPSVLIISDKDTASHPHDLISLCPDLPKDTIIPGSQISQHNTANLIKNMDLDYLICIHFPFIISKEILDNVHIGVLNLHPAYLPYNRGWHTPTWAILDGTPYGATLHFMDTSLDTGDIIHQKQLTVFPDDTADSLYKKTLKCEVDIFKEAWPMIKAKAPSRKSQKKLQGTAHKKEDIRNIQQIDLNKEIRAKYLIDIMRALTTNNIHEAAYFEQNGEIYRVQITITKDDPE